jgi:crotonobetainyl-CoA:carnitine CoA-transferase CaiB-like acyl-CoA transferase
MKDIVEYDQLAARNFWVDLQHPELNDSLTYPGSFVKTSGALVTIRCRAPLIGEHNQEVYQELGLTNQDLLILKDKGVI